AALRAHGGRRGEWETVGLGWRCWLGLSRLTSGSNALPAENRTRAPRVARHVRPHRKHRVASPGRPESWAKGRPPAEPWRRYASFRSLRESFLDRTRVPVSAYW